MMIPDVDNEYGFLKPALWWARQGFVVMPYERANNQAHAILGSGYRYSDSDPTDTRPLVGSVDPAQVWAWWHQDKAANIGIVTGMRSRLLVVDCDLHHGDGVTAFHNWCADNRVDLTRVPYVDGPSGGRHYYFLLTTPLKKVDGWLANEDGQGLVDIKADGCAITAPPSVRRVPVLPHPGDPKSDGPAYVQYRLCGSLDDMTEAPDALLADVRANGSRLRQNGSGRRRTGSDALSEEAILRDGLPVGGRNSALYRIACRWWRLYGLENDAKVWDLARRAWEATPQYPSPFPWSEAQGRVESARSFVARQIATEKQFFAPFLEATNTWLRGNVQ